MNHQARPTGNLERRIHDAERDLFAAVGAEVEEFFLDLARTGLRVRVLSHGRGPAVVLLHGASESAAIWAPLFPELRGFRLLAVDLPGHGLSDPVAFRRGQVREHARALIEDILDALGLDQVPVIGHSLGGMFALWHAAAGSGRICEVIAIGEPAVALPGVRVRMPLSLLTVRGLGVAVLALTQPASCLPPPARPGDGRRRHSGRAGPADRGATPVRTPAGERENRGVAHARDRPVPPPAPRERPDQRRTRRDHDTRDLHPRIRATRTSPSSAHGPSIDQIHGARLYEMPGGHAPWLADAQHTAELIATRSHLATGPHLTPAPRERRQANAST